MYKFRSKFVGFWIEWLIFALFGLKEIEDKIDIKNEKLIPKVKNNFLSDFFI